MINSPYAPLGYGRTSWSFCAEPDCERKVGLASGNAYCQLHRPKDAPRCCGCQAPMPKGDFALFCEGCR